MPGEHGMTGHYLSEPDEYATGNRGCSARPYLHFEVHAGNVAAVDDSSTLYVLCVSVSRNCKPLRNKF